MQLAIISVVMALALKYNCHLTLTVPEAHQVSFSGR